MVQNDKKLYFYFFNWDSLHARLNSHYKAWSCKKQKQKKVKAYRKSIQKEDTVKRCLLILDLKVSKIIGQWKAFYRHKIQESSCVRKETVGMDILITSRNSDRKIMQYIRIASRPPSRIRKWNQFSQFSNTYGKDLSWLQFDDEPRVQGRQQVMDQQSCVTIFVAYPTIRSRNQKHQLRNDKSVSYMSAWSIYRDTEQPQEKGTSHNKSTLQFSWKQV